MALIQPTLAEPLAPEDAWRQAAERVTPLGEYLGAKALGGLEATRPVEALELGSLPSRYAADEYGLMPPGPPPADLMSKEQFDASPHARPGLEWEEGETEARAAARAAVHDRQAYRDSLVARSDAGALGQAAGLGLGLGAAALDPTNYIPLVGAASKAVMVARFGRIVGALLMHGSEAALNTGLFEPLAAETARVQGRSYGWEEAGADILVNALGGAVLGTAVGEGARALGFGHGAAPERGGPVPAGAEIPLPEGGRPAVPGTEFPAVSGSFRPPEISATGQEFTKPITDAAGEPIGRIVGSIGPGEYQVGHAEVSSGKGQGHAVRAYAELADHVLADGKRLVSDSDVTLDAARVYEGLQRRGYTVERAPSAELFTEGGHSTWRTPDDEPVFSVTAGPKAAPPEAGAGVVPRRPGQPPLRVDDLMRRADGANLALDQIDRGEPVDVGRVLANDPAVREPAPLPPGIDAYHGTPHLFDEFSGEKINTGEGAQAFGHGLYFAEHQDVAETYRKTIASPDKAAAGTAAYHLDLNGGDKDAAKADLRREIDNLERRVKSALRPDPSLQERLATNREALKLIDSAGSGHLYKVRLAMEHGDLLDWDKPLSEQSPKVREAVGKLMEEVVGGRSSSIENATGAEIYKTWLAGAEGNSPATAARLLREAGIHGIRYLDSGSRDAAEGTRNIVVFDPARVHVLERNGMSLATAAPEPPHPSVAEAAPRVGKAGDELATFKEDAKLEGYEVPLPGHEPAPEPGSAEAAKAENAKPGIPPTPKEQAVASAALPPELQEVEAMRREGTLAPADEATLAAGEAAAQQAEGYATAYETLLNCVLRNV